MREGLSRLIKIVNFETGRIDSLFPTCSLCGLGSWRRIIRRFSAIRKRHIIQGTLEIPKVIILRPTRSNSIAHSNHFPAGHLSWGRRALACVKQPHKRQRRPVWCRQASQVLRRRCRVDGGTVFSPDPTNFAAAVAAETAMRSNPGPFLVGAAEALITKEPVP